MSNARIDERESENSIYRDTYQTLLSMLIIGVGVLLFMSCVVMYQIFHRPKPAYYAVTPAAQRMDLTGHDEPNLLPDTLTRWASKAAVAAYTFDFVNYSREAELAKPYFTDAGWTDYISSIAGVISTIEENQLFVNGVVSGAPVISNEGEIPGRGYVWRVQIPFVVTYQSADKISRQHYTVIISIVKVPTTQNPQGIGVDQFVMS